MLAYRISSISIGSLWGRKDFHINLKPDVNILIGPNASGKTTILNLLHHALAPDPYSLAEIQFKKLIINLKEDHRGASKQIVVEGLKESFKFLVDDRVHSIVYPDFARYGVRAMRVRQQIQEQTEKLSRDLRQLIPCLWLPVSRRLPMLDEDVSERMGRFARHRDARDRPESVDERLAELITELQSYRYDLERRLSEQYRVFVRNVLRMILYDPAHDNMKSLQDSSRPTDSDKEIIIKAFRDADIFDRQLNERINEHFDVTNRIFDWVEQGKLGKPGGDYPNSASASEESSWWLMVLPLIPRTRAMVEEARQLENNRQSLFGPLNTYERLVSDFFNGKSLTIADDGQITITTDPDGYELGYENLSSGEKQILILLTQALVEQEHFALYIADEPELSLHVEWQQRLLSSIRALASNYQIVVATHSPDIVGPFADSVISLADDR